MNRHQHGIRSRGCIWERAAVFRVKLIDRRANWPWMSSDTQMLYSRQHKLHGPLHPPFSLSFQRNGDIELRKKKPPPAESMTNLKRRTRSSDTFQNTHKAAAVSFSALKRRFLWGFFFVPLLSRSARLTSPRCSRARSLLQGAAKTGVALGNIS